MPARYVTGYLYSDANGQAHGESHAWAELYVDGLGWVGFDAANRCCPNDLYVRLGSGLDAQDAAPIRGLIEGQATEDLTAKVIVTDVAQQQ
jgi:transglutaminase-like putative cysteine protease